VSSGGLAYSTSDALSRAAQAPAGQLPDIFGHDSLSFMKDAGDSSGLLLLKGVSGAFSLSAADANGDGGSASMGDAELGALRAHPDSVTTRMQRASQGIDTMSACKVDKFIATSAVGSGGRGTAGAAAPRPPDPVAPPSRPPLLTADDLSSSLSLSCLKTEPRPSWDGARAEPLIAAGRQGRGVEGVMHMEELPPADSLQLMIQSINNDPVGMVPSEVRSGCAGARGVLRCGVGMLCPKGCSQPAPSHRA
jgi:hypothetical protein